MIEEVTLLFEQYFYSVICEHCKNEFVLLLITRDENGAIKDWLLAGNESRLYCPSCGNKIVKGE